ncbi:MAG: hypothetical protein KKI12_02660 [Proteobacteria bacterium]|nr:hypothetical protein [Pseudomonadota bacterium]MBU4287053.1 hypothetical protein [Pseudomonadota bacterium]MBU4413743.1 hypothetical protein [Pseudomonadota bacterium]MCG2758842.1 hypothetical protein [Desulfobacteraceae bacterium]
MKDYYHEFHIPVMGTGHSVDTPIRVACLGITSVISLVDDLLLEKIRKYYSEKFSLPYSRIPANENDGRAKRITAYLETVQEIVRIKMDRIKKQPFFKNNEKSKYFDLLPEESPLKKAYNKLLNMKEGSKRSALENELTGKMKPGSIDVNIMVKLDRIVFGSNGEPLGDEFSDAKTALRGYANSSLKSGIVFSAGINQRLFNYMARFKDFYRDKTGQVKKKIILKVSDFRSSLIQGKFLAKRGLEVHEFRIESGLNCGGHTFASNGILLPTVLKEFKEKREKLADEFLPLIKKYYNKMGWEYAEPARNDSPLVTVQGGIGNNGEVRRLKEDFGMDLTGWGSPFLLVPETTCIDNFTLELLKHSGEKDLYLSDISPLGVPFSNLRKTGSEIWTSKKAAEGNPGSPCRKKFLVSNTEFTKLPICLASKQYQKMKLEEINKQVLSEQEKEKCKEKIIEKTCICNHLGNGALIALGISKEENSPQSICPGPNIAWFNRIYTLKEMVDHIYGRGPSLVPSERPHMFAKEIEMYVDYFERQVNNCDCSPTEVKTLKEFKENLEKGMNLCLSIAQKQPFEGENLASIPPCVEKQKTRLESIYSDFEKLINKQPDNLVLLQPQHSVKFDQKIA